MSNRQISIGHRPGGVWVMTFCNLLFAGLASIGMFDVVLHPGANWNEAIRIAAPYVLGLILLTQIFAVGAWAGSARARITLIIFLSLLAVHMMAQSVARSIRFMESGSNLGDLPISELWNLLVGPAWVFWLAVNYWYFFRSTARGFYSS